MRLCAVRHSLSLHLLLPSSTHEPPQQLTLKTGTRKVIHCKSWVKELGAEVANIQGLLEPLPKITYLHYNKEHLHIQGRQYGLI